MSTNDKIYNYLRYIGLTGSINDMLYKWYSLKGMAEGQNYYLTRTSLFGSGQQGAWYDPSNLNTLFQDSAGTVPVTAMEQPVGRMLDLSWNGNHAFQATSTKRGVVSRRVNLLAANNNSAWSKTTGVSSSVSGVGEVHSGSNVLKFSYNGSGNVNTYRAYVGGTISASGAQYSAFVYLRADAPITVRISGNNIAGPLTTVNVTTSWQKFSISGTGNGASVIQFLIYSALDNNDPFEVYLSSADARLSIDDHLPYQWVNTATDYDADPYKFPTYIRFDGVDDAYQTNSIDFTGTDKMTVWAGVQWNNFGDATGHMVVNHNSTGNNSFFMMAPTTTANAISANIWGSSSMSRTESGLSAGAYTAALTLVGNLTPASIELRRDSLAVGAPVGSTGGGSFANAPLFIGSQSVGMNRFFNGRLYGLIVAGDNYPLSQIESVEYYIKRKTMLP